MIVVEGPDGAGKTTLINLLLADNSGLFLRPRMSTSIGGPVDQLTKAVDEDFLNPIEAGHVYDRHALISEPIYGPVIRGSMKPGFEDWNWFCRSWSRLQTMRPLLIFCLPPLDVVRENLHNETHGQMSGVVEHIDAIYWGYWTLAMRSLTLQHYTYPRVDIYDYTRSSWCGYEHVAEDVRGHLEQYVSTR